MSPVTASILLGVAGIAALVWRVWLDHQRDRKEATVLYLTNFRPEWVEHRKRLDGIFGPEKQLTEADLEGKVANNQELYEDIRGLLGGLEYLCVGINTGVFDLDILYRTDGSDVVSTYNRLQHFINSRRIKTRNTSLYLEFETVVNNFRKRMLHSDSRGNIRYLPWRR